MNKELKLTVNGQPYELSIKPKTLLVEVLRNHLALTGTKRGCESGSCGACTVVLNGLAVKSCSILALQADGAEITTIEGLARGEKLHPLQRAFLDYGAYPHRGIEPSESSPSATYPLSQGPLGNHLDLNLPFIVEPLKRRGGRHATEGWH